MPSPKKSTKNHDLTPCRLKLADWPVCYENNCYLNYCCPSYQGIYPNPVRDYIPMPPVFFPLSPYHAIPFSYKIQIVDLEEEEW